MPSLFSENVEIQSFVEDNKQFKMLDNMNCHGQSSDPANKGLNASLSQDCHEEVISRPLRKKRNKIQKNLMNSQST